MLTEGGLITIIKVINKDDVYDFEEAEHFAPKIDNLKLITVVMTDSINQEAIAERVANALDVDHIEIESPNSNSYCKRLIYYIYELIES